MKNDLPTLKGFNISRKDKETALRNNKMLALMINMNKTCNLNCSFCFQDAGKYQEGQINIDQYKNILDQSLDLGCKYLYIVGAGEPFLDDIFYNKKQKSFPLLDYVKSIRLYSVVFTNSTKITETLAKELYKLPVSFMCKLNSFDEKLQNRLIGRKNMAKKLYFGIDNLIRAGFNKESPTRLSIDTLICKDTYDEILNIINWAFKNNIFPVVESVLLKGRALKNKDKLLLSNSHEKNVLLEKRLRENYKREYPFEKSFFGEGYCDLDQYSMTINFNGDVCVCPGGRNNLIIGNIKDNTLKDLWNNDHLLKLRKERFVGCDNQCPGRIHCASLNISTYKSSKQL